MKTKKITNILTGLMMVLALTVSSNAFAGNNKDKGRDHEKPKKKKKKTDSVPLDGGLSILLLGAAAFGAKKLHDNK